MIKDVTHSAQPYGSVYIWALCLVLQAGVKNKSQEPLTALLTLVVKS